MGKGINLVVLDGNAVADPELKYTAAGNAVCSLRMATNTDSRKREDGTWEDIPAFHRCVIWGSLGEAIYAAVGKGDRIRLDGSLQTRKYQDHEGKDRYITEVRVEAARWWSKKDKPQSQGQQGAANRNRPDDDIPF